MLGIWISYILDALLALGGAVSIIVSLVRGGEDYNTVCFRIGGIALLLMAVIIFLFIHGHYKTKK